MEECGASNLKVLGISKAVSRRLEGEWKRAHKESSLRISVCEYDAPITMLGSVPLDETFLGLLGLFRQKGEVLLLKELAGLCANVY